MSVGGTGGRLANVEREMQELKAEMKDLRTTVYATGYRLAFAFVVAAIGFGFGAIRLGG